MFLLWSAVWDRDVCGDEPPVEVSHPAAFGFQAASLPSAEVDGQRFGTARRLQACGPGGECAFPDRAHIAGPGLRGPGDGRETTSPGPHHRHLADTRSGQLSCESIPTTPGTRRAIDASASAAVSLSTAPW